MTYCYFFGFSSILSLYFFPLRFQTQQCQLKTQSRTKGKCPLDTSSPVVWVLNFGLYGSMERITCALILVCCRLTKPLSFADCVGDELPWGWEAGFDPQIGVYYIDHVNSKFLFFVKVTPTPNLESLKA